MIISAVVSADSPFQTSLSFLLRTKLERYPVLTSTFIVFSWRWAVCSAAVSRVVPLLALAHPSELLEPIPIFPSPGPPSKEAAAVLWALETFTDPKLVETAAELILELRWPGNLGFLPALIKATWRNLSFVYEQ
jgi:hypothetical protein